MSNVLDFQVSGAFPSKVGGTGQAVKYFPRPLGPSIGVAPTTPSSTSAAGALLLPAANVYNGQQFSVIATGSFGSDSGDPSGNVLVQLYAVTGSLTAPVYTAIARVGAAAAPTVAAAESWAIAANLYGDSNSGVLGGEFSGYLQGTLSTSPTGTLAVISGLNFNTGNPALAQGAVLGFVVGVTFGTSDPSNTASLFQFTIES